MSPASRVLSVLIPSVLVAYAVIALASRAWVSGLAAPVVAWLLWRRHPRARFSAYVLLSVLAGRAVVTGTWWLAVAALTAITLLQLPAAARVWPRIRPGFDDKMSSR